MAPNKPRTRAQDIELTVYRGVVIALAVAAVIVLVPVWHDDGHTLGFKVATTLALTALITVKVWIVARIERLYDRLNAL